MYANNPGAFGKYQEAVAYRKLFVFHDQAL